MRAESELPRHRWWHTFSIFTRKLGLHQQALTNVKTGEPIFIVQRTVEYCLICREEYTYGRPMQEYLAEAASTHPGLRLVGPGQAEVVPFNKLKLEPVPGPEGMN